MKAISIILTNIFLHKASLAAPVVFIPGIAGSGILARSANKSFENRCGAALQSEALEPEFLGHLRRTYGEDSDRFGNWSRVWISIGNVRPPASHQRCWFESMTLEYSPPPLFSSIGTWHDKDGVQTTVDEGVHGVDFLDYIGGYGFPPFKYFHDIISAIQSALHYDRSTNMTAFPYDWRLPPWQIDWERFRDMIEQLYATNNGQKVFIISHSMGAVWASYFFQNHVSAQWKQKYIEGLITINGANGGSFKAVRALLSGYNPLDMPWLDYFAIPQLVPDAAIQEMSSTFASLYTLVPQTGMYSPETKVASMQQNGEIHNYTLSNWTSLIASNLTADLQQSISMAIGDVFLEDPGVPVYCLYSTLGLHSTDIAYGYSDHLAAPTVELGEGDGTLPLQSLQVCRQWQSTRLIRSFDNLDHMYILRDAEVARVISSILSSVT